MLCPYPSASRVNAPIFHAVALTNWPTRNLSLAISVYSRSRSFCRSMVNQVGRSSRVVLSGLIILGLLGCQPNADRAAQELTKNSKDIQSFDNSLTFSNIVLQESDLKGSLLWKMNAAQATYSKDKKNALVVKPNGELYQDGKAVFKLVADKGEVIQDGKSLVLKGQITATDLRDGTVMKGNEIEWKPAEDTLFVRNQFSGARKDMAIKGKEGKFISRKRLAEVTGQVVVDGKKPAVQFRSEALNWDLEKEIITSVKPLQFEKRENQQITDRASAAQGNINLKTKVATLTQSAQVNLKSNYQINSDQLVWRFDDQVLTADKPLTVVNPADQVTLTANQGSMTLKDNMANLVGNVHGTRQGNQDVNADTVAWNLSTQAFTANGNVTYRQNNPPTSLVGTQATGRMEDQQVVVTGGPEGDNRTIMEIVPNQTR
jgi:LPS export ABC transporter protein LptC